MLARVVSGIRCLKLLLYCKRRVVLLSHILVGAVGAGRLRLGSSIAALMLRPALSARPHWLIG